MQITIIHIRKIIFISGYYANAHRGKVRKTGGGPLHPPIIEDEVSFVPSIGWAEMIRKVYSIWQLRKEWNIYDTPIPWVRDKGDLYFDNVLFRPSH